MTDPQQPSVPPATPQYAPPAQPVPPAHPAPHAHPTPTHYAPPLQQWGPPTTQPIPAGIAPAPPLMTAATSPVDVRWAQPVPVRRGFGGVALSFAIVGLAASFLVGWAFPIAIAGIVFGIIALRRPEESKRLAVWGICLGVLAVIYSAGWLLWAAAELGWLTR